MINKLSINPTQKIKDFRFTSVKVTWLLNLGYFALIFILLLLHKLDIFAYVLYFYPIFFAFSLFVYWYGKFPTENGGKEKDSAKNRFRDSGEEIFKKSSLYNKSEAVIESKRRVKHTSVALILYFIATIVCEYLFYYFLLQKGELSLAAIIGNFIVLVILVFYCYILILVPFLFFSEWTSPFRFNFKDSEIDRDYFLRLWNVMAYETNAEVSDDKKRKSVKDMFFINQKAITLKEEKQVLANLEKEDIDTLILIHNLIENNNIHYGNGLLSFNSLLNFIKSVFKLTLGTSAVGISILSLGGKINLTSLKKLFDVKELLELVFYVSVELFVIYFIFLLVYHTLVPVGKKKQIEKALPRIIELAIEHKK